MLRLPDRVYIATAPINMHLSFDRLAGIVRQQFGGDPRGEAVFVFHNRRRTLVKLLWHDGTGYAVLYKRLDSGAYRIPLAIPSGSSCVSASRRELELLLKGVNRELLRAAKRTVNANEP